MDKLSNAINNFYQAFADVSAPDHIDGCPCCITEKEIQTLLTTPLRELSQDDLASYASSALLTVGSDSDYLYYLPRIVEISISDDSWWPDIEVTARAIESTNIESWPEKRRDALIELLDAVIDHILDSSAYDLIDQWVYAAARMKLDVRRLLAKIERNADAVLEYWVDNAQNLHEERLGNAFWELPNEGHDEIVRWFQSEPIRKIYSEAYGYGM